MIFAWPQNFSARSSVGNLEVPHGNLRKFRIWEWHEYHLATLYVLTLFQRYVFTEWTWVTCISNVLSIKTILFDILDFWCQLVVIWFMKTLSKRRMFVSFMKISACWSLHRLIKLNKICWEKRPAKPRPNLQTSFCRRHLENTQPHLKGSFDFVLKSFEEEPRFRMYTNTQYKLFWIQVGLVTACKGHPEPALWCGQQ